MKKELLIAALGIGFTGALDAATRREVEAMLAEIAKAPAPKAQGTMRDGFVSCYVVMGPPERLEYVCPICGEKTLHARGDGDYDKRIAAVFGLSGNGYRKQCERLRVLGWKVKLDESFLCAKCRNPEQPEDFFLEITIDKKVTRTRMKDGDLDTLVALAEKKRGFLVMRSFKEELPRLRELLGVSEKEQKSAPSRIQKLFGVFEKK